jgi:hypothetical protein
MKRIMALEKVDADDALRSTTARKIQKILDKERLNTVELETSANFLRYPSQRNRKKYELVHEIATYLLWQERSPRS